MFFNFRKTSANIIKSCYKQINAVGITESDKKENGDKKNKIPYDYNS